MKMTKLISLLFAVLSVGIFLAACSPVYQTNYGYVAPKSWKGKQCVNRCLRDRSYCRAQCQSSGQACKNTANLEAMPAYLSYVEQQKKQNLPLDRSVGDFADYSSCTDHCGCESTYRECYANCGGQVVANTQCVAFCKK